MGRVLVNIAFGAAVVGGGIYLYKKYGGGRRKEIVAGVTGVVLGDKVGGVTGYLVGGPAGAIVGSVIGAVAGSIAAHEYLLGNGRDLTN